MKLLLTSGGLSNDELSNSVAELAGKPLEELSLAYIPTAANVIDEDKSWLVDHLVRLQGLALAKLDIVDFSGLKYDEWFLRLDSADVLVFEGGSTSYLINKTRESGLRVALEGWLDSKVYVGVSAGSVMVTPVIGPNGDPGLAWVDFLIVPHMNAPYRNRKAEDVQSIATKFGRTTFWIDDESAIRVNGTKQDVIGNGCVSFNG